MLKTIMLLSGMLFLTASSLFCQDTYDIINAIQKDDIEEVKALINKKNIYNESPLYVATKRDHQDIIEYLKSFGAKP